MVASILKKHLGEILGISLHNDRDVQRYLFTHGTCELIAKRNGHMTAQQVHCALLQGQSVYSNFRRFVIE